MAQRFFSSLVFICSSAWASTADSNHEIQALRAELAELRARAEARFHPANSHNTDTASPRRLQEGLKLPTGGAKYFANSAPGATAARAWYVAAKLPDMEAGLSDAKAALSTIWLLICGTLVMFMHPGFAMLEAGSCRAKNATNVLFKNLVNVTVGTVAWYIFGWAFAYGGPGEGGKHDGGFIGYKQFASSGFLTSDEEGNMEISGTSTMLSWYFQWAFCTAAATIVSGGIAERVRSATYAAYAFVMAAFIYPVVVAWTWGYGWLSEVGDVGYMDFAGSGVVHLTGGISAFAGAAILGPRKGRWETPEQFDPHSLPLVVMGTFCLWFGWYGFNCGSTLSMESAGTAALAAQVAMNTTMSASVTGLLVFSMQYILLKGKYDVPAFCNGILAGLVSITAGCGNVETGSAIAIGIVGAFVFQGVSMLVKFLKIDDPVDAAAVHGGCGIWGVLAAALFDWGNGFDHFHGWSGFSCMQNEGGSCRTGIGGTALGVNIAMILSICAWTGLLSGSAFFFLTKVGYLRISAETEEAGQDEKHHSPGKTYEYEGEEQQMHADGPPKDMERV